jgi:hypothetical protein
MAPETRLSLQLGELLQEAFRQPPDQLYNPVEQQLILETVLLSAGQRKLNVGLLKLEAKKFAPNIKQDADFDRISAQLLDAATMEAQK